MKRRLLTIAVCLLLGAVVNVAVAWGCAVWIDVGYVASSRVSQQSESDALEWQYSIYRRRGGTKIRLQLLMLDKGQRDDAGPAPATLPAGVPRWHRGWPRETQVSWYGSEFPRTHEARGWPLLSMWSEYFTHGNQTIEELRSNPGSLTYTTLPYRGIALKTGTRQTFPIERVLPLGMIWPGFAVNTLLYAGVLWLLVPGPFALRRFVRHRRGLCLACGYDLTHGEHAACPECGWRRAAQGVESS